MNKKWYESRTLWFNVVGLVVVVLEYLGTVDVPVSMEALTGALAVGNFILRFRTNEGLKM